MQAYFDQLDRVRYEGSKSSNPLAFRHYNPDELVLGKRMEEHLRFAACYWHTFCWNGADMFGVGAFNRPWQQPGEALALAKRKADVAFEFFHKLHVPFYCFHDVDIDFYISFDNEKVGELQAKALVDIVPQGNYFLMGGSPVDNNAKLFRAGQMKVLKPYVDSGKIKVVGDQWVDGWLPENALKIMENALTANNNKIDAVVASNDATAGGAIQALSAQGLSGKVAISGQDADLAGIKRIAAGTQTMTVYKPITLLANTAAEIAVELGNGQEPKADTTLNNGLKDVPSRLLTPIDVNKNNIKDTVVKDGFHKESEL